MISYTRDRKNVFEAITMNEGMQKFFQLWSWRFLFELIFIMKAISMWLNKKDPQCLFKLAFVILCGNIEKKTDEEAFVGFYKCKSLLFCGPECRRYNYSCFNYHWTKPYCLTEYLKAFYWEIVHLPSSHGWTC